MNNKKNSNTRLKENIVNGIIFTLVFVVAILFTTQALARKINSYQTMNNSISFVVKKQKVNVVSAINGRIKEIKVTPGEHVNKGDLLLSLDMSEYNRKVEVLKAMSDSNLSAKTELNTLLTQKDYFNIYAPQDGVVSEISVTKGSYIPGGTSVVTLFSDYDAQVIAYATPVQYEEVQNKEKIRVYSDRLKQAFELKLNGIGKMTTDYETFDNTSPKLSKYELVFSFTNPDDGAVFIEQESLHFINIVDDKQIKRPSERIKRMWNALILGK